MSTALDLEFEDGERKGERVALRPDQPLKIGRSARGLQLVDPLVSMQHCVINWEGDRYWLEDAASQTGTYHNGERLADKPVPIAVDDRIRIGDTQLVVVGRRSSRRIFVVAGVIVALLVVGLLVRTALNSVSVRYEPTVRWHEPVNQFGGLRSDRIDIPVSFVREAGVDHRGLTIERVSDYDADGVDELWLRWDGGRRLVTFGEDNTWITLASFDDDCRVRPVVGADGLADSFPDLACSGRRYRFGPRGYEPLDLEGILAWLPPTEQVKDESLSTKKKEVFVAEVKDGPVEPYLMALTGSETLRGFLNARGVMEPVHYLICEGAIKGVAAQVLTASGRVVPLSPGCIRDVELSADNLRGEYGVARPRMIAFTTTGYDALRQDVMAFLGGDPDGLLLDRRTKRAVGTYFGSPKGRAGSAKVRFLGDAAVGPVTAAEAALPPAPRLLRALNGADAYPPPGRVITITEPGRVPLDSCAELDVKLPSWSCVLFTGCTAGSTFATVTHLPCEGRGRTVQVPFDAGATPLRDKQIDGRVVVETAGASPQTDVLRVRFAWRPRDGEE